MLTGHDIIYFSNDWHAVHRTSSHHMAEHLARANRLLYVEAGGLRAPAVSGRDLRRVARKLGQALRAPEPVAERVSRISLFQLPFHRVAAVRAFNQTFTVALLRRAQRRLGMRRPILWLISPHMVSVVGHLDERLVVYYCPDDFARFPGVDTGAVRAMDEELTRRADIVFVASETLIDAKRALNPHVHLSPHGVDFEHFARALDPALPVPEDLRAIPRPVLGFFGLIERWIDLELVAAVARRRPDWHFVLIGQPARDMAPVEGLPNVHLLGPRPYASLPSYTKGFDVAVIPYVLGYQVLQANPKKLREYLASGKPVVSVRTPEIARFADVVRIADSADDFVAAVGDALAERGEAGRDARMERVRSLSWERRAAEVFGLVAARLAAGGPGGGPAPAPARAVAGGLRP